LAATGITVYSAVVATLALVIGGSGLGWNIINALRQAKAQRAPDVHGVMVTDSTLGTSELAFRNAGPGMARHLFFLGVESGTVYQGPAPPPFIGQGEQAQSPQLPFIPSEPRSTFVWAYMDADHNVHARSNHGEQYVYEHPARVEMGEVFQRLYPSVSMPARSNLPLLGEL
jgi:hypothetical protein